MNGSTNIFTRINEMVEYYGSTCDARKSAKNGMAAMKSVAKYLKEYGLMSVLSLWSSARGWEIGKRIPLSAKASEQPL